METATARRQHPSRGATVMRKVIRRESVGRLMAALVVLLAPGAVSADITTVMCIPRAFTTVTSPFVDAGSDPGVCSGLGGGDMVGVLLGGDGLDRQPPSPTGEGTPNNRPPITSVDSTVDPVAADGEFYHAVVDLKFPGFGLPFVFKRTYRSRISYKGVLGYNWDHSFDKRIFFTNNGCSGSVNYATYHDGELGIYHFVQQGRYADGSSTWASVGGGTPLELAGLPDGTFLIRDRIAGIRYSFDTSGYLAWFEDTIGDRLYVHWVQHGSYDGNNHLVVSKVVDNVYDTTLRTIYFNYDSNYQFLQCLALQRGCSSPLVTYTINTNASQGGFAELTSVLLAGDANGESYKYDDVDGTLGPGAMPEAMLAPLCGSVCNTTLGPYPCNQYPSSANLDTCDKGPQYCTGLASGNGCVGYCLWGGSSPCCTSADDVACGTCQDNYCDPECASGGSGLWQSQSQDCTSLFQSAHPYCGSADCTNDCINFHRGNNHVGGPAYVFGQMTDLTHNLIEVDDGLNRMVIQNTYGTDPLDVSFDRVTKQVYGTGEVAQLQYHDLNLEANPPSWSAFPPSNPNNVDVVPLGSFSSVGICGECDGTYPLDGRDCGPPTFGETGTTVHQIPHYALVITDTYGVKHVQYYDSGWHLLREVNRATGETTNYNYENGNWGNFLNGVITASGMRTCTQTDDRGMPVQIDRFPIDGLPGNAAATRETFDYGYPAGTDDTHFQFLNNHVLDTATGAFESFDHDPAGRITGTHKSVSAQTQPDLVVSTTVNYLFSTIPSTITAADNTQTTMANIDPWGAAPRTVTIDAAGASPVVYSYGFDTAGNLTTESQANRMTTQYAFDSAARMLTRTRQLTPSSPAFTETTYWDYASQPDIVSDPEKKIYLSIDSNGHVTNDFREPADPNSTIDPEVTCRHVGVDGRVLDVINPEGDLVHYEYDLNGRLTRIDRGYPTSPPPWAQGQGCTVPTIPDGDPGIQTVASFEYGTGGIPLAVTKEGVRTHFVTDGFGRIIESQDPIGRRTRVGYDSRGRVTWRAVYDGVPDVPDYGPPLSSDTGVASIVSYSYDDLNRPVSETEQILGNPQFAGNNDTTYQYDDLHSTISVTRNGRTTTRAYDGAGRLIKVTLPDQSTVTYNYTDGTEIVKTVTANFGTYVEEQTLDGLGLPASATQGGDLVDTVTRDVNGRVLNVTTPSGNTKWFVYDPFGRVSYMGAQTDGSGNSWQSFTYDRDDRVVSATDADTNTTQRTYDGLGRLMKSVDPLLRSTVTTFMPGSNRGDRTTYASGRWEQLNYDPAGQLIEVITHQPDIPIDLDRQFSYDAMGRVTSGSTTGGTEVDNTTTRLYDSRGYLCRESNTLWPFDINTTIYDNDGGSNQRWVLAGTTDYATQFDDLGRATAVIASSSGLNGFVGIKTWDYGTMGPGRPLSATSYQQATARLTESYTYDNRGRLIGMDARDQNGAAVYSVHDALGADGYLRARQRTIGTGSTKSDLFQVDYGGRVTAENPRVSSVPSMQSGALDNDSVAPYMTNGFAWRNYQYDGEADPVQIGSPGFLPPAPRNYDAVHKLLSGRDIPSPTYDADDRLTSAGLATESNTLTYNPAGQVTTASDGSSSVEYVHDAFGRRILEISGGVTNVLVWDGQQLLAHGSTDTGDYTFEFYGDGIDNHIFSGTGDFTTGIYYLQAPDHSVLAAYNYAADGTPQLQETYSYSSFGVPTFYGPSGSILSSTQIGNRFLFQGQVYDPIAGTYYLRNREYAPTLQRFLTPDPLGFGGGTMNLLAYCAGAPLAASDPLGLSTTKWGGSDLGADAPPGPDPGRTDRDGANGPAAEPSANSDVSPVVQLQSGNPYVSTVRAISRSWLSNFVVNMWNSAPGGSLAGLLFAKVTFGGRAGGVDRMRGPLNRMYDIAKQSSAVFRAIAEDVEKSDTTEVNIRTPATAEEFAQVKHDGGANTDSRDAPNGFNSVMGTTLVTIMVDPSSMQSNPVYYFIGVSLSAAIAHEVTHAWLNMTGVVDDYGETLDDMGQQSFGGEGHGGWFYPGQSIAVAVENGVRAGLGMQPRPPR